MGKGRFKRFEFQLQIFILYANIPDKLKIILKKVPSILIGSIPLLVEYQSPRVSSAPFFVLQKCYDLNKSVLYYPFINLKIIKKLIRFQLPQAKFCSS